MLKFFIALLNAIPILYSVWQKSEQEKLNESIENDVYASWSDKFGELQREKRIASSNLPNTNAKRSASPRRDLPD